MSLVWRATFTSYWLFFDATVVSGQAFMYSLGSRNQATTSSDNLILHSLGKADER